MDFKEIPYSINDEDAAIFVTDYDGKDFNYEVCVVKEEIEKQKMEKKYYPVVLTEKQKQEVYLFIEQYIVDKEISYTEWLEDGYYDELSEGE